MISVSALAKKMNITTRRLRQIFIELKNFVDYDKIKPNSRQVDPVEFFLAYIKLIEHKNQKRKSKESELEKAQIRLRIAQAQRAELDFEKENQTLVNKEISIKFISNTFGNVRNKLLNSPNKIAFQVYGAKSLAEAKNKSKNIVNDILNELSDPKELFKNKNKMKN